MLIGAMIVRIHFDVKPLKLEKELRTMLQNKIRRRATCVLPHVEQQLTTEIALLRFILEENDIYLEP